MRQRSTSLRFFTCRILLFAIALAVTSVTVAAQQVIDTIPVGTGPFGTAVNPATNKIYVANLSSNNVTVIDGTTLATTTISVGTSPYFAAVNPVTNHIYTLVSGETFAMKAQAT